MADDDDTCDLPGSFPFEKGEEELQQLRDSIKRNLRLRPIKSVGNLRSPDREQWFTPLVSNLPHPIHPSSLLARLDNDKKPLLLDTRPLAAFKSSHIRNSINLAVPSLILKRWKKGRADYTSLRQYITTDAGRATWDNTLASWDGDIILCDQDPLMHILPTLLPNGQVDYLFGGITHPLLKDLLVSDTNAPSMTLTVDTAQKYKPKQQLEIHTDSPINTKPNLIRIDTRSVERLPKLSLKTRAMTLPPTPTTATSPSSIYSAYYTPPHTPSFKTPKASPRTPKHDEFVLGCSTTPTSALLPPISTVDEHPPSHFTFDDPPSTDTDTEDGYPQFISLPPAEHVHELQSLGVKRILNLAEECNADDWGLALGKGFERYVKIGMRDTVEEEGVGKGVREVCRVLDDARLHSAPVYVHCKAGKSRSVTAVIAYLIHSHHWTLGRAYKFVLERRKGISPNIGFVSELMNFEEEELGGKSLGVVPTSNNDAQPKHPPKQGLRPKTSRRNLQQGNVEGHGHAHAQSISGPIMPTTTNTEDDETTSESTLSTPSPRATTGMGTYTRYRRYRAYHSAEIEVESTSTSKSPGPIPITHTPTPNQQTQHQGGIPMTPLHRLPLHDPYQEMEVRDASGRYRHARRAPVDEETLQPMRRVSKAGLESGVWEG
ncbi:hypothetical protein VNI00_011946 [Paramarasmius palmivorus]|uniref:protein-tyrosine-phosphatase n=1 Tax=Paramarasmius palmivorus TaxID=297713 RepID=A0AAW0C7I7_9AGAR